MSLLLVLVINFVFSKELKVSTAIAQNKKIKIVSMKITKDNKKYIFEFSESCLQKKCMAYQELMKVSKIQFPQSTVRYEVNVCEQKLKGRVMTYLLSSGNFQSFCQFKDDSLIALNSLKSLDL